MNGVDYIDVIYERDLADSDKWTKNMEFIFDYLDLEPVEVAASTIKTSKKTIKQRVSNYQDIIDYLKGKIT